MEAGESYSISYADPLSVNFRQPNKWLWNYLNSTVRAAIIAVAATTNLVSVLTNREDTFSLTLISITFLGLVK